ncbi:MAG: acyl--CoA ligase [Alphaproteobacteria bacterium]|nr:acyl--CoA ligase [Alphaproteobacteria bacterium]
MLMGDLLRQAAARHPAKPALIQGEAVLSYAALDGLANRIARAFAAAGLTKGDRVAVLSRNRPEYVALLFGAARSGTVLTALSPLAAPAELAHILTATRARCLAYEAEFDAVASELRTRVPSVERHIILDAPAVGSDAIAFARFIDPMDETPPALAVAATDPLAMTFTGGTTGFPKGAVVSHRARVASAMTTALEHELTAADVVGIVTPLYHAIGLLIWLPATVLVGATAVILPRWDAQDFAARTRRHGITAVLMVPVQARQMLDPATFDAGALASLRKIGTGGAPMPPELPDAIAANMPWAMLVDHYGQSETGPLTVLKPWHPAAKRRSIGLPAIGVDLRLVAPDGSPVAAGEVGEIVVRGPFVMDGYFENAAETAAFFREGDGWGWTGDLARCDEDGFLTLVGRSKEMIITGGLNVYPREVEVALEAHDAVAECAVFGVPDPTWGEALVAVVVLHRGISATPDELLAHCGARLARYKRPKVLRIVTAIPKTPAGKVQKPAMRAAYLAETGAGPHG